MVDIITSSSSTSKVSTLLPAPPPPVNPWNRQSAKEEATAASYSTQTDNIQASPESPRKEPLSATNTIRSTKKFGKWVPLEAEISVALPPTTKARNKSTSNGSTGTNNNNNNSGKKKKDATTNTKPRSDSRKRNNANKNDNEVDKPDTATPAVEEGGGSQTINHNMLESATTITTTSTSDIASYPLTNSTAISEDAQDPVNEVSTISKMFNDIDVNSNETQDKSLASIETETVKNSSEFYNEYPRGREDFNDNRYFHNGRQQQQQHRTQRSSKSGNRNSGMINNGGYKFNNKKNRNSFSNNNGPYYPVLNPPYYYPYFMPPPPPPQFMHQSNTSSRRNSQKTSPISAGGSPSIDNSTVLWNGGASGNNSYYIPISPQQMNHYSLGSPPPAPIPQQQHQQLQGSPPLPSQYMESNMYYFSPPPPPQQQQSQQGLVIEDSNSPAQQYQSFYIPPPPQQPQPQPMYPINNYGEEKVFRLIKQIEYYFSIENLLKDVYLRKHMNSEGYINITFLANFSRVKAISEGDFNSILQAIKRIEFLQVSKNKKVRLREGWEQWVLSIDQRDESAK